jgi:hypothetical protein
VQRCQSDIDAKRVHNRFFLVAFKPIFGDALFVILGSMSAAQRLPIRL